MNLLSLLTGSLTSGSSIDALSGKTGLSSAQLTKLLPLALPLLLKFLTRNASSADGAQSLLGALGGHKETRSMAEQISGADEEDGAKIVKHIFGDQTDSIVSSLAKDNEMEEADVSKALSNIAPAMMSGLSAATTSASRVDLSDGLDLSDLMGMFGGAGAGIASAKETASSGGGLLGGLLGGGKSGGGLLGGGLLGGLLGGADKKEEEPDDGTALLGMLTSLMK